MTSKEWKNRAKSYPTVTLLSQSEIGSMILLMEIFMRRGGRFTGDSCAKPQYKEGKTKE